MKTIILITDAFPYGSITENSFIAPEISYLSEAFDRVIIAPRRKIKNTLDIEAYPENVEISDTLLIKATIKNKFRGVIGKFKSIIYDLTHSKGDLRQIIAYASYVGISVQNIRTLINEKNIDLNSTLFYTFWFDFTTAALTYFPGVKFITRTHGHDLYEDRYFISSWWRRKTFKKILKCYCISNTGYKYLTARYPQYAYKIGYHKLGTTRLLKKNFTQDTKQPINSSLTLVGIARVSPEKGVIRQVEYVKKFAEKNPDMDINYIHIGDGPLIKELRDITKVLPTNLKVELKGALHNSEVHKFFLSTHIDAVLLLSYTEGLPIVLCEAISYGIPYVATDVGGISEILPSTLLPLISKECSYSEFSHVLKRVLSLDSIREEVKEYWKKNFDAIKLRNEFANEIKAFLD